jgi:hypothetical protein
LRQAFAYGHVNASTISEGRSGGAANAVTSAAAIQLQPPNPLELMGYLGRRRPAQICRVDMVVRADLTIGHGVGEPATDLSSMIRQADALITPLPSDHRAEPDTAIP